MSTAIAPEPRTVEEEIEFRRQRQTLLGGSDVAKIFGYSDYGDARSVYYSKVRPLDEDAIRAEMEGGKSVDLDRGHTFEPIIAARFFQRTGREGRNEKRRPHPEYPFLNPEPDRIQYDGSPGAPAEGTGALEIKAPRAGGFAQVVQADAVRDRDLLQLQFQMLCRGYRWGTHVYGSWESSQGPIIYFDVEASPEIARYFEDRLVEFWRHHVEERIPPDPDAWASDGTMPTLPEPVGSDYWKPSSLSEVPEELEELVTRAVRLKDVRKRASDEYDDVRDEIAAWIREHKPEFAGVDVPGVGKAKIIQRSGSTYLDKGALRESRPVDRDALVRFLTDEKYSHEAVDPETAEKIAEDLALDFEDFEREGSPSEYVGIW